MNPPSLDEMIGHVQKLPAMPAVAIEVLRSMAGADVDIDTLARHISQDQVITARVLRVANSPFYGLQSRVGSLHDAILVVGPSAIRWLVLAASVMSGLPAGRGPGFSQKRFWRHVLGTAVAAQALASPLKRPPEALFLAGLLHDIGRLAMMLLYPEHTREVLGTAAAQDCRLEDAERNHFGFDHSEVGAALAQRWNFPADIVDALAWHHRPALGMPRRSPRRPRRDPPRLGSLDPRGRPRRSGARRGRPRRRPRRAGSRPEAGGVRRACGPRRGHDPREKE